MAAESSCQHIDKLPKGWKLARLGDMISLRGGLSYKGEFLSDEGNSLVTMGCVSASERFKKSGLKRYNGDFTERHRLRAGDMVIATRDVTQNRELLGSPALIPEGLPGEAVIAATNLYMVSNQSESPTEFIYWLMKTPAYRNQIVASAKGTTIVMLTKDSVENFTFPLPPLSEQKRIAEVLGALDDKIELNRRMNATLEATARTLFQSWFVDFDPIREKLDGRQPSGMDTTTAALFPDAFEESERGHIPKGWEVGRVSDVSEFSRSSINPGEFPEETFDHYSLPAFDEGRTPKAELGSEIMSNKLAVTTNSVLLSKLNPHIPRIWLPDLHETRRSVCSTEFIVASTRSGFSREFIFSLFTNTAFASTYGTLVTGTTGSHQRIRPESVLEMKTIIPTPPLVEAFTHLAKPMFDQINRNIEQSRTLATLRDTLLPKLLSGGIKSYSDS